MNYTTLASPQTVATTQKALEAKNYQVKLAASKTEALELVKQLVPSGATVMHGSSVTLEQIGYVEFLQSAQHGWVDLHAQVNAENDKDKRALLRKQSILSDYYLGSVHALMENGDYLVASNTGSQLPHVVYSSQNLVYVVSTKKIVPNLDEAFKRLESHVIPLEHEHMQQLYHMPTTLNKIVISKGESPMIGRTVTFILVAEDLGF